MPIVSNTTAIVVAIAAGALGFVFVTLHYPESLGLALFAAFVYFVILLSVVRFIEGYRGAVNS